MEKYIFILGNNPLISQAEILAVLPELKIKDQGDGFLIGEIKKINCEEIISILGGTIKIGQVIGDCLDEVVVIEEIKLHYQGQKIKFGFSFYYTKQDQRIGLEIKKRLRVEGINSRLVTSRDKTLSAVIIKKEKAIDFLVLPGYLGVTSAVQKFEEYGERDFGRPKSDAYSGMLPPKLARMMINLAQANESDLILDPFCGSGTILGELLSLDYKNIIGCDKSGKAVSDSQENIEWLEDRLKIKDVDLKIFKCEAEKISESVKNSSVDHIVTEPYLGPPIRGGENSKQLGKIKSELENLYLLSFKEFKKILKPGGRVIMIWPQWHIQDRIININIEDRVDGLGFKRLDQDDLIYKRENQKVWRRILIWEK